MFFCEKCQEKNDWPGIIPMSLGTCEECGTSRVRCFDIPSSRLRRATPVLMDARPITAITEEKKETGMEEEHYVITLKVERVSMRGPATRVGSPSERRITDLNTTLTDTNLNKAINRAVAVLVTARP